MFHVTQVLSLRREFQPIVSRYVRVILVLTKEGIVPRVYCLVARVERLLVVFHVVEDRHRVGVYRRNWDYVFTNASRILIIMEELNEGRIGHVLAVKGCLNVDLFSYDTYGIYQFSQVVEDRAR